MQRSIFGKAVRRDSYTQDDTQERQQTFDELIAGDRFEGFKSRQFYRSPMKKPIGDEKLTADEEKLLSRIWSITTGEMILALLREEHQYIEAHVAWNCQDEAFATMVSALPHLLDSLVYKRMVIELPALEEANTPRMGHR